MSVMHNSLATAIVKHQQFIIGEALAWSEARKVPGLIVEDHSVKIRANGKKVLELLVEQYAKLFGQASVEACKDAVKRLLPKMDETEIPKKLV